MINLMVENLDEEMVDEIRAFIEKSRKKEKKKLLQKKFLRVLKKKLKCLISWDMK